MPTLPVRRLAVAALCAVTVAPPASHAVPRSPLPTLFTSPNVHLVRNVPTGVGIGGKFSGHYYFQSTARATGYRGPEGDAVSDGGLWVFDVADPENPVLAAHVPLPIWQNEDVDLSVKRGLLLVANERRRATAPAPPPAGTPYLPGSVTVFDISEPTRPVPVSTIVLPAHVGTDASGEPIPGAGHTASCIRECEYVYVAGARDGSVAVVDLRDPANPVLMGYLTTPAGAATKVMSPGMVHDVNVDPYGNVWLAGSGGTFMYEPVTDPMRPVLVAGTSAADNARTNQAIHHNTMRLDKHHVMISEEAYTGCGADEPVADDAPQGGRFQIWRIDRDNGRLVPVSLFQKKVPGIPVCSSHWMDVNAHQVVADAFYEGGVRFLDIRDRDSLRQVGWFRPSDGGAAQVVYVPGRPDLVYVSDFYRGLDIVRIDGGGQGAPTQWETGTGGRPLVPGTGTVAFAADDELGWACRVPV
ncbi:MAG TPA: hypothetical protein VF519_16070 [Mycobacteriales bacterium]|jgi:hypothetical protein